MNFKQVVIYVLVRGEREQLFCVLNEEVPHYFNQLVILVYDVIFLFYWWDGVARVSRE
jgi:hypothetical protein